MRTKVLFRGLGSIGLRNLRSALRVRPDAQFAAWRSSNTPLPEDLQGKLQVFTEENQARDFAPDLCVIATPTARHREDLESCLRLGRPAIFLEKPAAHTVEDLESVHELVQKTGTTFFYGCVLRFHPLLRRARALLQEGSLGEALSASVFCGSYLPDWRPGRDYREIYSAQRAMGGGVSLDLIHEFDYAEFLLGPVQMIEGFKSKVSHLEMDVDDLCEATLQHAPGASTKIHLDYFRKEARRDFEIACTQGALRGNMLTGELEIQTPAGIAREIHAIARDDLHDLQSQDFFDCLESGRKPLWNLDDVIRLNRQVVEIPEVS